MSYIICKKSEDEVVKDLMFDIRTEKLRELGGTIRDTMYVVGLVALPLYPLVAGALRGISGAEYFPEEFGDAEGIGLLAAGSTGLEAGAATISCLSDKVGCDKDLSLKKFGGSIAAGVASSPILYSVGFGVGKLIKG